MIEAPVAWRSFWWKTQHFHSMATSIRTSEPSTGAVIHGLVDARNFVQLMENFGGLIKHIYKFAIKAWILNPTMNITLVKVIFGDGCCITWTCLIIKKWGTISWRVNYFFKKKSYTVEYVYLVLIVNITPNRGRTGKYFLGPIM